MKRFCILLTAILLSSVLNAQQTRWFKTSDPTVTVSGVITDEITGEGIQFASVVANEEGFNYAISDSDGRYSINVIPGEVELRFNSVSYKKETVNISTETDTTVNCALMPYEPQTVFRSYVPKRFEFDARFFNTLGITNVMDAAQTILGLEGRYNFRRIPMDVGLNFSYSLPFTMEPSEASPDTPVGEVMSFGYWAVQAVTNYNYYRWHRFTPYVGLGIGAGKSSYRTVSGFTQDAEDGYPRATYSFSGKPIAVFSLRAGFEINTRVKFFFEQHFNTDNSRGSYFGLTYVL
jgi:opacity protein-like surface antigen